MNSLKFTQRQTIIGIGVLIVIALYLFPRQESLQFFLPERDCPLRVVPDSERRREKMRPLDSCRLGEAYGRDTGKQQWRVTVRLASDRTSVLELTNEITGEQGRYEVVCEANRVELLAFKHRGEESYRQVDWINRYSTDLSSLPEEYQRQMLRLCPAKVTPSASAP